MADNGTLEGRDSPLRHMPQLDGLRAFAVLAVFVHHFYFGPLRNYFPFGRAGVRLFFVLSGFLITGILLRCRALADSDAQPRGVLLRQFYLRRALRIFPAYYLLLGIASALNVPTIRQTFWWHVTYLSNFLFAREGDFKGPAAHFWTLAVEEQFYVFWPCLAVFAPRRLLVVAVVAAVGLAPLYRLVALLARWNFAVGTALPFACLDSLGLGAALALASGSATGSPAARERLCRAGLILGLPAVLAMTLVYAKYGTSRLSLPGPRVYFVVADSAIALLCTWVVGRAANGFGGAAGRVLECAPLVYVGRISYGLYLYHMFCPLLLAWVFAQTGRSLPFNVHARFILLCLTSFALAVVSWHAFEAPLNRLKRFVAYGRGSGGV